MRRILALIALALSAACSSPTESSAPPPPPPPPPPAPVSTVELSPSSLTLTVDGSGTLTAVTRDASGTALTGRTVSWSSSQGSIATVNNGVVTGVAPGGPVTITATSEGKSATATVTVSSVPVASVSLDRNSLSVVQGGTGTIVATAKDANGVTLPNRAVSWETANPAIATVANGVVTGIAPGGPVLITVTCEGKTATAQVTVTQSPVATVSVTPPSGSILMGTTTTLTATPKDQAGAALTGRIVTWSSSNQAIATVSNGVVTGIAPGGPVTITATSETKTGTAQITVTAPLGPIWTESDELRIGAGDAAVSGTWAMVFAPDGSGVASTSTTFWERSTTKVWNTSSITLPGSPQILAFHVDPNNTVWAVGTKGLIARRSGGVWVTEASGINSNLWTIAIRADGSGFAGGDGGILLKRSTAGVWTAATSPTAHTFVGIATTSANFALATATGGQGVGSAWRWDGATWTATPLPTGFSPSNMVLVSSTEAYASGVVGNNPLAANFTIVQWDGTNWSIGTQRPTEFYPYTAGYTRCANGTVYFGTKYGGIYRRQGPGAWTMVSQQGENATNGYTLACDNDNTLVLAAEDGLMLRYNGAWTMERFRPNLTDVAMASATTIYVANNTSVARTTGGGTWTRASQSISNGAPVLTGTSLWADATQALVTGDTPGRFAGGTWTWFPGTQTGVAGLWGPAPDKIFSVGRSSELGVWNGSSWSLQATPNSGTFEQISGVGNFGVAMTNSGVAIQWNGTSWLPMPPSSILFGRLQVFSSTNVWVIGSFTIQKWDGASWTTTNTSGIPTTPTVIVARGTDEVFGFYSNNIYRLNGAVWTLVGTTSRTVRSAAIFGNQIVAVGDDGLIVRATLP